VYSFRSNWERAPRLTLPGTTLLAVGDVHGCSAHLVAMLTLLGSVIAQACEQGRRCELVMIGDYIDRGPDSLGVLKRLGGLEETLGIPVHLLQGNHDQFLIEFLHVMPQPDVLDSWCANGGHTTLAECGVEPHEIQSTDPAEISARVRARLGPRLIELLRGLAPYWLSGGYLFVHGGVDPARPLETHSVDDLVWLREPFLSGEGWQHPFAVVHGHTPFGPEVFPHRIGIDSGCFGTGVLTAVELAGDCLRFHGVATIGDLRAFRDGLNPDQARAFTMPEPLKT
jgi:serine/threonine protein phosphatase 1